MVCIQLMLVLITAADNISMMENLKTPPVKGKKLVDTLEDMELVLGGIYGACA